VLETCVCLPFDDLVVVLADDHVASDSDTRNTLAIWKVRVPLGNYHLSVTT
jgi:hypothetical protein